MRAVAKLLMRELPSEKQDLDKVSDSLEKVKR
jgi:hypothetical protein